jgi:hypothetical protein
LEQPGDTTSFIAAAHLKNFMLPTIALGVIVAFVALGPLALCFPRLSALRRKGILEYGILGQLHSAEFHEKWILHRADHEAEFLQAPESSALADFGPSYEKIEPLSPFPDKQDLIPLALARAIPAFPVVIAQIPVTVVLTDLLRALRQIVSSAFGRYPFDETPRITFLA